MKLVVILALLGGLCRAQVNIAATQYSDEARLAGLEGPVLVTGVPGADGVVRDIKITRPLGLGLDEIAAQAVAQHRAQSDEIAQPETYAVEFTLPEKQSHWHLAGVEFKTPAGASRPTFAQPDYPVGRGIGVAAYDEAQILAVIGRAAEATLTFDIDEQGYPGNFTVMDASEETWGPQAAMLVRTWRFHPGMKSGMPVVVPCTVNLIWGPADFNSGAVETQVARIVEPPPPLPPLPRPRASAPSLPPPGPSLAEMLVSKVEPEYTDEARQAGVEGSAILSVVVDPEGKLARETVQGTSLDSKGELGAALLQNALQAVMQWRFQQMMLNGTATAYSLKVLVSFQLTGEVSTVLDPPQPVRPAGANLR